MAQQGEAQNAAFNRTNLITYPGPMKMLGSVVLNTKKDIKFNRNLSHPAGARNYAQARQWHCQVADINNDGEDDIVLFDKNGKPVFINGYSLKPSEHKIRQKFYSQPINTRIEQGGYNKYKTLMRGNPGLELEMQGWDAGYAKIRKPPRRNPNANPDGSLYKRFCVAMKQIIDGYIRRRYAANGEAHPSLVQALNKIIPFTSVQAYFYIHAILDTLWNEARCAGWRQAIVNKSDNQFRRCDLFKRYLSKNSAIVDTIITPEMLANLSETYTDEQMERCFTILGINHDDIYQEAIIPADGEDLTTPQNRGIIASEKEAISEAILTAKDQLILNVFHPARENPQFQPPDTE